MVSTPAELTEDRIGSAMTDASSRAILMACVDHARSAKELSGRTGIPLTTVYRQVHKLQALGVLVVERSALTPDGRKYDLYRSRVRAVLVGVDDEGAHVSWTPNGAVPERSGWDRGRWDVQGALMPRRKAQPEPPPDEPDPVEPFPDTEPPTPPMPPTDPEPPGSGRSAPDQAVRPRGGIARPWNAA